jgi:hypothetical protein
MNTCDLRYTKLQRINNEKYIYHRNDFFNTRCVLNFDYHSQLITKCCNFFVIKIKSNHIQFNNITYKTINEAYSNISYSICEYICIGQVKHAYLKYIANTSDANIYVPLFKYASSGLSYDLSIQSKYSNNYLKCLDKYYPNWREDLINLIKTNDASPLYNDLNILIEYSNLKFKNNKLFFTTNEYQSLKMLVIDFEHNIVNNCCEFMLLKITKLPFSKYKFILQCNNINMIHNYMNEHISNYIFTNYAYLGRIKPEYNNFINNSGTSMWIPLLKYTNMSYEQLKKPIDDINIGWEYTFIKLPHIEYNNKYRCSSEESIDLNNYIPNTDESIDLDNYIPDTDESIDLDNYIPDTDESIDSIKCGYTTVYWGKVPLYLPDEYHMVIPTDLHP